MRQQSHIEKIIKNYKILESEIVNQLHYGSDHGSTVGSNREYVWKELFERFIPKKFNIERSVFIMDSYGNISKEVDLAIYDEQYTPYIFRYGTIKFIPIEAVAAVIECKSSSATSEALTSWLDSIKVLCTGNHSLVRINGGINEGTDFENLSVSRTTQTSTTPIKILCHMSVADNSTEGFDIVIKGTQEGLDIRYNESYQNLFGWYLQLNHYYEFAHINDSYKKDRLRHFVEEIRNASNSYSSLRDQSLETYKVGEDNAILSFIFQFNQLLMLINNPLFFPHMDYVRLFREYIASQRQENMLEE